MVFDGSLGLPRLSWIEICRPAGRNDYAAGQDWGLACLLIVSVHRPQMLAQALGRTINPADKPQGSARVSRLQWSAMMCSYSRTAVHSVLSGRQKPQRPRVKGQEDSARLARM